MDCRNCAYYFEENPFWGGQLSRCLKSGKMLGINAIFIGCSDYATNRPRRLRKLTQSEQIHHQKESDKRCI